MSHTGGISIFGTRDGAHAARVFHFSGTAKRIQDGPRLLGSELLRYKAGCNPAYHLSDRRRRRRGRRQRSHSGRPTRTVVLPLDRCPLWRSRGIWIVSWSCLALHRINCCQPPSVECSSAIHATRMDFVCCLWISSPDEHCNSHSFPLAGARSRSSEMGGVPSHITTWVICIPA